MIHWPWNQLRTSYFFSLVALQHGSAPVPTLREVNCCLNQAICWEGELLVIINQSVYSPPPFFTALTLDLRKFHFLFPPKGEDFGSVLLIWFKGLVLCEAFQRTFSAALAKFHREVAAQAETKWRPIRARARSEWNKRCAANAFEKVQMQFLLTFFCFGKKVRNKKKGSFSASLPSFHYFIISLPSPSPSDNSSHLSKPSTSNFRVWMFQGQS